MNKIKFTGGEAKMITDTTYLTIDGKMTSDFATANKYGIKSKRVFGWNGTEWVLITQEGVWA